MATTDIRMGTPEEVKALIPKLRSADLAEMSLGGPVTEFEILNSSDIWLGYADDEPACAFGVIRFGFANPVSLWLITTPLIEQNKVAFLRGSRQVVGALLRRYGALTGLVQESNGPAREFAKFLGFALSEPFEAPLVGTVRRFEGRLF